MTLTLGELAQRLYLMPEWLEVASVSLEGPDGKIDVPLQAATSGSLPQPPGPFRIVIEVAQPAFAQSFGA